MITIEMLEPPRIVELWPQLQPLIASACRGHAIAEDEITAEDVFVMSQTDSCVIFAGFEDCELSMVMALQFFMTGDAKTADVVVMAGKGLMKFKNAYWPSILEWLRANGVKYVDAYAPDRLAKIYMNKFGFDKSCAYVRMTL